MSTRGVPKEQALLLPTFWVLGRRSVLGRESGPVPEAQHLYR